KAASILARQASVGKPAGSKPLVPSPLPVLQRSRGGRVIRTVAGKGKSREIREWQRNGNCEEEWKNENSHQQVQLASACGRRPVSGHVSFCRSAKSTRPE